MLERPRKLFDASYAQINHTHDVLPPNGKGAVYTRATRQIISGAGLTGGGDLTADRTLAVGAGTGITVNADDVSLSAAVIASLALADTALQPTLLTVDGDIIVRIGGVPARLAKGTDGQVLKMVAGAPAWGTDDAGGGSGTVDSVVGTTDEIDVDATDPANPIVSLAAAVTASLALADSALQAADIASLVANTLTLTAGAGLTGGGDLSANRTFTVGAGTGITVNADDVALSAASLASLALADSAVQPADLATVATTGAYSDLTGLPTLVTDHGALTGLTDDDHTQYVLRSILTTNGDIFIQSGGAIARLGIGADGKVLTVVAGAPVWSDPAAGTAGNPTASVGLAAVNGVATTYMRSDAAPALDQAISPTWTEAHLWSRAQPDLRWAETDQVAGAVAWRLRINGGVMRWAAYSDDFSTTEANFLLVTRSGSAIASMQFGNATDNPTYNFEGTGGLTATGMDATFSGGKFDAGDAALHLTSGASGFVDTGSNPAIYRSGSGWSTPAGFVNAANLILASGADSSSRGILMAAGDFGGSQAFLFGLASGVVRVIGDSTEFRLGGSDDFAMYHDGSNNYIDSNTGHLIIQANGSNSLLLRDGTPANRLGINTSTVRLYAADGTTVRLEVNESTGVTYSPVSGPASSEIGFRKIIRQTTGGTLTAAMVGTCQAVSSAVTVNNSVFVAGDSLMIYNNSGSAFNITKGTITNLRKAGTATDATLSLAQRGFATLWFNSATECIVTGNV